MRVLNWKRTALYFGVFWRKKCDTLNVTFYACCEGIFRCNPVDWTECNIYKMGQLNKQFCNWKHCGKKDKTNFLQFWFIYANLCLILRIRFCLAGFYTLNGKWSQTIFFQITFSSLISNVFLFLPSIIPIQLLNKK